MVSSVGRARKHGDATRAALLAAAERIVDEAGLDALTLRGVADEVGTTTHAVYSVFGSKDELLVALTAVALEALGDGLERQPRKKDPITDVVQAIIDVYRPFAIEHPALFRLAFHRSGFGPPRAHHLVTVEDVRAPTTVALDHLRRRLRRLEEAGLLGSWTLTDAVFAVSTVCAGLATYELAMVPAVSTEKFWRATIEALLRGFSPS